MKKQKSKMKPISDELTERVRSLWISDEKSALALGKALLEVKAINPHGFLGKWIKKLLGDSTSVRNRCSYCMRLALKKTKKPSKPSSKEDSVFGEIIHEVNERFKQLYDYAQAGDVDSAVITAKAINEKAAELVETAKRNEASTERAKAATA